MTDHRMSHRRFRGAGIVARGAGLRFGVSNHAALYAIFLVAPDAPPTIGSLGLGRWDGAIGRMAHGPVGHRRDGSGPWFDLLRGLGTVPVMRIEGRGIVPA